MGLSRRVKSSRVRVPLGEGECSIRDMGASKNQGPQSKLQNSGALLIRTPIKRTLNQPYEHRPRSTYGRTSMRVQVPGQPFLMHLLQGLTGHGFLAVWGIAERIAKGLCLALLF